jgi:UDP-2-acetamido-2,6-beta-L-arabino-hexul-4-ose reductase
VPPDGYYCVPVVYTKTLGEIVDLIYSFKASREERSVPDMSVSGPDGSFTKKLYATYLSYLPEDEFGYNLEMKYDNRGWLAEFIKSKQFGQIFISRTKPGITRGNHWHHTKIEKFLVIEGQAMIRFRQINGSDIIEYNVSGDELKVIDIPTGYTHSIENVGETDVITLFWADEMFNPEKPDTYYLGV